MNTRAFILLHNRAPAGRVVVQFNEPSADPRYKDAGEKLLDALRAKWTHRHGYTLPASRAAMFEVLYKAGFHGWKNPFSDSPATFSRNGGPDMPLKEALALARLGQAE